MSDKLGGTSPPPRALFESQALPGDDRTGMPDALAEHVILSAQAGNSDAIATLHQTYHQQIYRYFYYRTGEHHTAEDLTGEVFVKLIQSLPHYQMRQAPFRAWLFQIARNLAVDHYRRMSVRQLTQITEVVEDPRPTPEALAERRLTHDYLRNALRRLTPDQCDVIVMRFLADMPIAEVARILNKSESAIKNLQLRGLAALQQILAARKITYG
jgi:RNA polymerase sigma-70 factor (ECF subfamily)